MQDYKKLLKKARRIEKVRIEMFDRAAVRFLKFDSKEHTRAGKVKRCLAHDIDSLKKLGLTGNDYVLGLDRGVTRLVRRRWVRKSANNARMVERSTKIKKRRTRRDPTTGRMVEYGKFEHWSDTQSEQSKAKRAATRLNKIKSEMSPDELRRLRQPDAPQPTVEVPGVSKGSALGKLLGGGNWEPPTKD